MRRVHTLTLRLLIKWEMTVNFFFMYVRTACNLTEYSKRNCFQRIVTDELQSNSLIHLHVIRESTYVHLKPFPNTNTLL